MIIEDGYLLMQAPDGRLLKLCAGPNIKSIRAYYMAKGFTDYALPEPIPEPAPDPVSAEELPQVMSQPAPIDQQPVAPRPNYIAPKRKG